MTKYKQLVQEYKEKARRKYNALKKERRKRRTLPLAEQWELLKKDRQKRLAWKHRIHNVEDPREHYAQKKGYAYYRKLQHRKYKWGILIAFILLIVIPFASWYIAATRPLTAEQKAAREHSLQLARQVQDEGMVLLRNERNVLPLQSKKVSVFGAGAASPVFGGGGAGGIATTSAVGIFDALTAEGIEYDKTLYNLYSNYAVRGKVSTDDFKKPGKTLIDTLLPSIAGFLATAPAEMPVEHISADVMQNAASFSDTALYVVSRVGTETKDLAPQDLRLTNDERQTLQKLDDSFAHVIILANTTNPIELGFVEEMKHVDGVLWVGAPGEVGAHSIAAALSGKINPSGRLTDTYAYKIDTNPSVNNTGDFQYKNKDGTPAGRYFANYKEGIYTGYRYFETFVPDNEYKQVVQYPFGYGLSYSTFDWQLSSHTTNDRTITATVKVTNTGSRAGKDVVQLYYAAPYTGEVEKSKIALGGYAKTKLLQPGESEEVTISLATDSMASYDDKTAKAWVLDAGQYQLKIGRNVHDTQQTFAYTQPVAKTITTDNKTGHAITNRFDHARGDLAYLARNNPNMTAIAAPTEAELLLPDAVKQGDYAHDSIARDVPTTGAKHGIKLAALKDVPYDDPKWQQFLDQFTDAELVRLAGNGGYWSTGFNRLGVPRTTMYDGPASIRNFLQAWSTVAYPIPLNLAATWNDALAENVGKAMGNEARSFNVDAVYAPSLNLHRSPLGGRNFEYYSEDPLVAGRMGAAYTRGLQSTGTVAVMKHFAANDQETNRAKLGLYTWMTEQTLRELYLKPFEITVKEGNAHGAMSAFNRIGPVWAGGDRALLTDVLRNEWGFKGFVITDAGIAGQGDHFDALQAVEAGNDLMLGNLFDTGGGTYVKQLQHYLKEDRAGTLIALRNAAHNICYYVLQTSKL